MADKVTLDLPPWADPHCGTHRYWVPVSAVTTAVRLAQVDGACLTAHTLANRCEVTRRLAWICRALFRERKASCQFFNSRRPRGRSLALRTLPDPMGKSVRKYRKNRDYECVDPSAASAYYDDDKGSARAARAVVDHDLLASPRHFIPLDELAQGESSPLQVVTLLVAACVGPTVLVMPFVFLQGGFVMTIFSVLFVGVASHWASSCLVRLGVGHGIYSLQGLAQLAFGFRGAFVVAVAQFLVSLGLILVYLTIIFYDFPVLLNHALHLGFDADGWPMETDNRLASKILSNRTLFAELISFVVLIPMCLLLYSYRKLQNWIAVATFLLVIASLCVVGKASSYHPSNTAAMSQGFTRDYVAVPSTLCQAFGILATQFACQHHTFHAFYALQNRSIALFTRISLFASLLVLYLAYSFGVGGYVSFLGETKPDVTQNYDFDANRSMLPFWLFLPVCAMICTPMELARAAADHDFAPEEAPFRAQREERRYEATSGLGQNISQSQHKTTQGGGDASYSRVHVVVTFVLLAILVQIVALSSRLDLGNTLSVTGGLAGIALIFVFPAACYLKLPVSDDRRVGEIAARRVSTKYVPWASITVGIAAAAACIIANAARSWLPGFSHAKLALVLLLLHVWTKFTSVTLLIEVWLPNAFHDV